MDFIDAIPEPYKTALLMGVVFILATVGMWADYGVSRIRNRSRK